MGAAVVEKFGKINILVNYAGSGLLGAVEESSDATVRALYDTNVFGLGLAFLDPASAVCTRTGRRPPRSASPSSE